MEPFHHLTNDAVSLLLELTPGRSARILHWGAALGPVDTGTVAQISCITTPAVLQSGNDMPDRRGLFADPADGYFGRPSLAGHRMGLAWSPLFALARASGDTSGLLLEHVDTASELTVQTRIELVGNGLFRCQHTLANNGAGEFSLQHFDVMLPTPDRATEVLDFGGRWCRERVPGRRPVTEGSWVREGREGRPGHDFPHIFAAVTPQAANRRGEVWAVSLACSGNWRLAMQRCGDAAGELSAGELMLPGEIVLAQGAHYSTPWVYAAYSDTGFDGVASAFHDFLRARATHPRTPRPVFVNSWEAVYFEHDLNDLKTMAADAAALGVERFILDDGWFNGRNHDHAGLGDWWPDPACWPHGLQPLIEHVHSVGMDFGLWVEPEMVNIDSDLYRAHPDWVLQLPQRLPIPWRNQQVLNLANPEAFQHILTALDRLLRDNAIAFLKWDHNRPLIDAGDQGRAAAHMQRLAAGQLIDTLRSLHPGVEIETCASGGGRIDLETVQRTDRVAISDCVDPTERQSIQRWSNLLLPPELCGTEIASSPSHTTGRTHRLGYRAATAVFGQLGVQLDSSKLDPQDRDELAEWISFYKSWRHIIQTGRMVHADDVDGARLIKGVVSADGNSALFSIAQLQTGQYSPPPRLRLPGLDPRRPFVFRPVGPPTAMCTIQRKPPAWMQLGETMRGNMVMELGLASPILAPDSVLLIAANNASL